MALAIRHSAISALFVPAEPSEFEVYRRIGAEGAGVVDEATIAIVATDAGITAPIGGFEPGAIIPPVSPPLADYSGVPDPPNAERHLD